MTGFVTNPATGGFTTVGKPGYSITIPGSVSPELAAQAGRAMAADPANAAAILGELNNNPTSRLGPPALRFSRHGRAG